MDPIESALEERLELLENVKRVFLSIHPDQPKRVARGETQLKILDFLGVSATGHNRRVVSEALGMLGYDRVKIAGFHHYRKA